MEIYIHLPFCVKKCRYCDFLSFPAGREQQRAYVDALLREIGRAGEQFCEAEIRQPKEKFFSAHIGEAGMSVRETRSESGLLVQGVDSIFLGGGTPSVLPAEWICEILEVVRRHFSVSPDAEITIEANPGTVDGGKLRMYKKAGINRISFGCQSFHDEELKLLGRIHTVREIEESVQLAREAGFANLNLDLMSGLPGQDLQSWEDTLRQAIALQPEHISAYSLIIEEGTPFYSLYGEKRTAAADSPENKDDAPVMQENKEHVLPLPDEETERRMYERTAEILKEAGYQQYEISNYAKAGYACRHNLGYWTGVPYIGFGLGASGYLPHSWFRRVEPDQGKQNENVDVQLSDSWVRYRNTCNLTKYLQESAEFDEVQELDSKDLQAEFMILGLRLIRGVEDAEFVRRFGKSLDSVYGSILSKYMKTSHLIRKDGRTYFSRTGISVSNTILADFL